MTLPTDERLGQTTRIWEMIFPEHANHYGTLFGGSALTLVSKAAFIAASRHARGSVVMAACEKVEFYHPIAVGQLVELIASVSREGRSSMTVQVEVLCENLPTGGRLRAIDGHFEMVAVDEKGKPKPFQPSL